jgi:hypothetical protein
VDSIVILECFGLDFHRSVSVKPHRKYIIKCAILSRKCTFVSGVGILGMEVKTRINMETRIKGIQGFFFIVK